MSAPDGRSNTRASAVATDDARQSGNGLVGAPRPGASGVRASYARRMPRNKDGSFEADGLVKVRLVHAKHGSVLIPDHIFVRDAASFWLQPQWVYVPILHFAPDASTVLHVG
jgi:hypothetical protein